MGWSAGGRARNAAHALTAERPTPMLQANHSPPPSDHATIIEPTEEQGFTKSSSRFNYKGERFRPMFGDGADRNVTSLSRRRGLARHLTGALSLLPERPAARSWHANGDILTTVDLKHLLDSMRARAAGTMASRIFFAVPCGRRRCRQHSRESIYREAGLSLPRQRRHYVLAARGGGAVRPPRATTCRAS